MLVAKGREPIPSGFDRINNALYDFSAPGDTIVRELSKAGALAAQHSVLVDPQSTMSLHVPEALRAPASADIEPGLYDRRITVHSADGQEKNIPNNNYAVYVADLLPKDVEFARASMIAARQLLASEHALPLGAPALFDLEAVDRNDASLVCPALDILYAQFIVPGFRFKFEHESEFYEYHTNRAGSTIIECEATG